MGQADDGMDLGGMSVQAGDHAEQSRAAALQRRAALEKANVQRKRQKAMKHALATANSRRQAIVLLADFLVQEENRSLRVSPLVAACWRVGDKRQWRAMSAAHVTEQTRVGDLGSRRERLLWELRR